ncbi:unnamed protein product [Owenia fusiformis]|uniref:Uncharacterized protein n=1 Tax=Owenia fusiformis TaxID=6347 RepID=A0A8J1XMA0_OWEFU|nr:unnamed protein product [Owenia fusiformis]
MMQALVIAILFAACAAEKVNVTQLMTQLVDVDCTNLTGFKPVGWLATTYKDCVYVVCDAGNPDPELRKYPRACGSKFQTHESLSTPAGPLYWPPSCADYGLSVEGCIAMSTEICRVEVSTTDNINCGPTYKDMKEGSSLQQDDPDVVRRHGYCIFNDPHSMNPIYKNDTRLCARPQFANGNKYKLFHRYPVSQNDYVEVDGLFGGNGGHYLTDLYVNTAFSNLAVSVDLNGTLSVQETLKNPIGAGFPIVTYEYSQNGSVVVVTVAFGTDADGGKITIAIRGGRPYKMNVCINDPLNMAEIGSFGTTLLDETSYFGYLDFLEASIIPNLNITGENLLLDVNDVTYDVDTPMAFHKFRVQESVNMSCWHASDTAQLVNVADFLIV